jgi:DNA-binding SARP family transcriptional activator/DNA-binding NarL/FixJ family response regulator
MSKNSHTILVVDPDERSYKTFESALGGSNSVLFVPNGKTAIDLPASHHIDIIFVSYALNGTDGIMLLDSFKKRFPSIPVVLIAEQPKVDEVITAFRSGARELIVKPIDEIELAAVTKKIFGFVSKKKAKRRWFFMAKKETQTNNNEKSNKEYLKKIFQKSKNAENSSAAELNEFQVKETISLKEDSNNQLVVDALIDPEQLDKETHPVKQIKKSDPQIEAFFLGSFRVLVNDQPIESWPSKKGRSILAYILLNHKKKIPKDILMDVFWRDYSPDSARNNLNVSICGLRKALKGVQKNFNHILLEDDYYHLNPMLELWIDFEEFMEHHEAGQSFERKGNLIDAIKEYEAGESLYHSDFLEEDLYEDWPIIQRESLKDSYFAILDRLSRYYFKEKRYVTCIHLCQKILAKDNCREDSHRLLMRCFTRQCQRNLALRQFDLCAQDLKQELDVAPMKETVALYYKIRNEEAV